MMRGIPTARSVRFVVLLFLVALALDVAVAVAQAAHWYGWFPSAVHAIENLSRFGDVVVCASAALLSATARRAGLAEWGASSVRHRDAQVGAVLAGSVLPVLAAHAVTGAGMLALSASRGGWWGAGLWAVVALACGPVYAVLWSAVGALLGLRLPRIVAPALAALLPFALTALLDYEALGTPPSVFAYASSGVYSDARPTMLTLAVRLPAVGCCAAWAAAHATATRATVRAFSSVAASLTVAAAMLVGPQWTPVPGADTQACAGSAPTICLSRAYAAALPDYRSAIDSAWGRLPKPLHRTAIDADGRDAPGRIPVAATDGRLAVSLLPTKDAVVETLGSAAWPTPSCELDHASAVRATTFESWWLDAAGIPDDGSGPLGTNLRLLPDYAEARRGAATLATLTPAQRDAWVDRTLRAATCVSPR